MFVHPPSPFENKNKKNVAQTNIFEYFGNFAKLTEQSRSPSISPPPTTTLLFAKAIPDNISILLILSPAGYGFKSPSPFGSIKLAKGI